MTVPTVSVIIPTYNRRAYVQEAIDSVLAQTFTDYEIIVIDDGSTDGTGEALTARYGDRIRYVWQENQGESVARNRGIDMAQGEFIAFLDSDDLWLSEKLERQVQYLRKHSAVGAVTCVALGVDTDNVPLPGHPQIGAGITERDFTPEALLLANRVGSPTNLVVRRSVISQIGGFDNRIRYGEDWDFAMRLRHAAAIAIVKEPLSRVRFHANNQWRPHSAERLQQILDDHLSVVTRGVLLLGEHLRSWEQYAPHAEALRYADVGVAACALGDHNRGYQWLREMMVRHHLSEYEVTRLGGDFAERLVAAQLLSGMVSVESLEGSIQHMRATLRKSGLSPHLARIFMGSSYSILFFNAAGRRDKTVVRWAFVRAPLYSPRILTNRGYWSLGLLYYFGLRTMNLVRRFASGIVPSPLRSKRSYSSNRRQT